MKIREATRLTQGAFVNRLNEAARQLYDGSAPHYTQSAISKLENGPNAVTLVDVAIYAEVDKNRRGKLWLAWGETVDRTMRREIAPDYNLEDVQPTEMTRGAKKPRKREA